MEASIFPRRSLAMDQRWEDSSAACRFSVSEFCRLIGLHFLPQLVVQAVRLLSQILEHLGIFQLVRVRKESLVILDFRFQKLLCCLVWGGIGNVFKIFLGNIRSAQEVNPLFCIFLIFRIFRDHPGVNPDIRSLLRDHVFQAVIQILSGNLLLDKEHLAGVDDAHGGLRRRSSCPAPGR